MLSFFIIGFFLFTTGFFAGRYTSEEKWLSEDWEFLKWSEKSLGYRPMFHGSKIHRNDKVFMSLRIDTKNIPLEGLKIEKSSGERDE